MVRIANGRRGLGLSNKLLLFSLAGLRSTLFHCRDAANNVIGIRAAMLHLKSLQIARSASVTFVVFIFCAVFLATAWVLIHIGLYALLMPGEKAAWILFGLGAVEFFGIIGFLSWYLSSERWLREAKRDNPVLKKAVENEHQHCRCPHHA